MVYPPIIPIRPWFWGRCRWFPWLPRWWWTGIYGPILPYSAPYFYPPMAVEDEVKMLEEEVKYMGEALENIKRRLEELKK